MPFKESGVGAQYQKPRDGVRGEASQVLENPPLLINIGHHFCSWLLLANRVAGSTSQISDPPKDRVSETLGSAGKQQK